MLKRLRSANWRALLRGIYEYNILRHFRPLPLRQLVIDVTYRCNSRCVMCNIWNTDPHLHRSELSPEQFDQILSDPLFKSVERLMISGGEPTLRNDLPELLEICFKRMPSLGALSMLTNGLWPERSVAFCEKVAKRCSEQGIQLSLSVSLDGVAEAHDMMRNIPGAFDKAMQTLDGLLKLQEQYRFYLGVGCVICHLNLPHLDAFATWCQERNLDCGFQLVAFHDTYVDNMAQRPKLDFDQADRQALYRLLEKQAAGRSLTKPMACYWADMLHMYRDGSERQSPCPFQVDSLVLDAYGNIRLCEAAENIGNCLESGESSSTSGGRCTELYYGPRTAAMRQAMVDGVCRKCNSGCLVNVGWRKDILRYLRFLIRGD
jgi:MoaA/NifB/PqqE/SkfB family radical SAM enzyme